MSYTRHRIEELIRVFEEDLKDVPFMYSIHYAYEDTDINVLTTEVGMNCRPIFAEGFLRDDANVNAYFEYKPPVNYEMRTDAPVGDLITSGLSGTIDKALERIYDIVVRPGDDGEVLGICVTIYYLLDDPSRPDLYSGKRQVYALYGDDNVNNHDQFFETVMALMRDFDMTYLSYLVSSHYRYAFFAK